MLDYTPKEITERKAIVINPAKTCQPVGAMYAALGVHNCLPHSHGSQGCCAFHRMFLTRHFKDPAMASSSSFTEGASVFGGGSNLKTAVKNIFDLYHPEMIAVHTTCLSETIGDDLNALIIDMDIPDGKYVVHCNTPSYKGSHVTGFTNMVSGFIKYLAKKGTEPNGKVCIMPGFVNPGDMREYKKLANALKVPITMLPDTSGVMDSPMTGKYEMYPKGGTLIDDIKELGGCIKTVALGVQTSEPSAEVLRKQCGVEYVSMPLPMGVEATDNFIMELQKISKEEVPYEIEEERGQLIDIMIDIHPYTYGKKVAIFGDPDTVLGIASFALELGMIPKYMVTGTPGAAFETAGKALLEKFGVEDCTVKAEGDLFLLHQWIKNEKVDLIIGGTHGKTIARAEDIPLVRMGFPIIDRYIHSYMPLTGYRGAMRMAELIASALMDYQDSHCEEKDVEVVM
ncbi:nitrogenase component 1 [Anaeromicropila populeti]|uniref:Nitrogenase molybdenum-iron protein beta chain n=1 Tax=Anaeromicropila populeti TaxID=37658 RepID=A0A1I6HV71_9FIRM|nr:nitrogenase component 1 [Anaeromicropila populeti]SFR58317.1 nitrogenase molybdenum-iron protein beta chain [Anaeromicropila populeti]